MGVLSRLFSRGSRSVHHKLDHFARSLVGHFNHLKDDFEMQKKWVHDLHNYFTRLHSEHHNHRAVTEKELNNIKSWVNHIYHNQSRQEKDLRAMEKNISELISVVGEAFNDVHSRIERVEKNQQQKHQGMLEHVKKMVQEHKALEAPAPEPQQTGQESFMQSYSLTNPENKFLNLLLSETDPVGYNKMAEKTGKSINTVRVVMNSLKKKGFIEENVLPSGEKLFNAKNKERIKKMYNISQV